MDDTSSSAWRAAAAAKGGQRTKAKKRPRAEVRRSKPVPDPDSDEDAIMDCERTGVRRPFGAEWHDEDRAARMPVKGEDGRMESLMDYRQEQAAKERSEVGRPYAMKQMEEDAADEGPAPVATKPLKGAKKAKLAAAGAADEVDSDEAEDARAFVGSLDDSVDAEDFGAERDAAAAGASEVLAEMRASRRSAVAPGKAGEGTRRLAEALGRGSYRAWRRLPQHAKLARRRRALARIAELSQAILSAPEKHIGVGKSLEAVEAEVSGDAAPSASSGGSKKDSLSELHTLCSEGDPVLRRAAMLSEMAVLKDVVPGYRIRVEAGGDGTSVKLSKDIKKLRRFEAALLAAYRRFLVFLEAAVRATPSLAAVRAEAAAGGLDLTGDAEGDAEAQAAGLAALPFRSRKAAERRAIQAAERGLAASDADAATARRLGMEALRCQCSLMAELPHFNFTRNLIAAVMPRAACHPDSEVSGIATSALRRLFAQDSSPGAEASLEAIRAAARLVRKRGARVRPELVRTLASLPIRASLIEEDRRERREREDAKKRKGRKKGVNAGQDEVAAAMAMADADDRDKRVQGQVDMLASLFHVYFRVLRSPRNTKLLPVVLEGLAKFSHLADAAVVVDLVQALRDLVASSTALSFAEVQGMADAGGGEGAVAAALAADAEADAMRHRHAAGIDDEDDAVGPSSGFNKEGQRIVSLDQVTTFAGSASRAQEQASARPAKRGRRDPVASRGQLAALGMLCPTGLGVRVDIGTALRVVSTAMRVLAGPGKALDINPGDFVAFLYRCLLAMCAPRRPAGGDAGGDDDVRVTKLAIDAVSAAFLQRREEDDDRVAAVFARLLIAASTQDPPSAAALIALARSLLARYPNLAQCMEPPADRVAKGVYSVDGGALGSAAGLAASAWPLTACLLAHWHPAVRAAAQGLASKRPPPPTGAPGTVLRTLADADSEGVAVMPKPPGPLGITIRTSEALQKTKARLAKAAADAEAAFADAEDDTAGADDDDSLAGDAEVPPAWAFGEADTVEAQLEKWEADPAELRRVMMRRDAESLGLEAWRPAEAAATGRTEPEEDSIWALADGRSDPLSLTVHGGVDAAVMRAASAGGGRLRRLSALKGTRLTPGPLAGSERDITAAAVASKTPAQFEDAEEEEEEEEDVDEDEDDEGRDGAAPDSESAGGEVDDDSEDEDVVGPVVGLPSADDSDEEEMRVADIGDRPGIKRVLNPKKVAARARAKAAAKAAEKAA